MQKMDLQSSWCGFLETINRFVPRTHDYDLPGKIFSESPGVANQHQLFIVNF